MLQKIINFTPLEKTGESKKTKTSLEGQKIASKSGFLDSLTGFIKYHNAVSIAISLVLVLSFSAMASEDVRDAVLGEKIVIEKGIDNSALLAADLANFDLAMKIIAVSQDPEPTSSAGGDSAAGEQNYYITYIFKTLGIEDNRWQEIAREKILTVSKNALGSEDLGIYATEEIGEVADNELAYLKEVQAAQRAKGETKVVQTTNYTGLIGLVLDVKNKILPGYEPVIKPPEVVVQQEPEPAPIPEPETISEPKTVPAVEACQYKEIEGIFTWEVNEVVLAEPDFLFEGDCAGAENEAACQAIWCRDNQPGDVCSDIEEKQTSADLCPVSAPPAEPITAPEPEPEPVPAPEPEPVPEPELPPLPSIELVPVETP